MTETQAKSGAVGASTDAPDNPAATTESTAGATHNPGGTLERVAHECHSVRRLVARTVKYY